MKPLINKTKTSAFICKMALKIKQGYRNKDLQIEIMPKAKTSACNGTAKPKVGNMCKA